MALVECKKCGWKWNARGKPKRCPNCHDDEWWEASSCERVFVNTCNLCGYQWETDLENPKRCPKCDSIYWDSPAVSNGVCTCQHCGHVWRSRLIGRLPKYCPICNRKKWMIKTESIGPPNCECQRCGHKWTMRQTDNMTNRKCPKCGTRRWKLSPPYDQSDA